MATYKGIREDPLRCVVTKDGEPLAPRLELINHSPTGFEWGYGGAGPAQLALAILADHLGDREALRLHPDFKSYFVAALPEEGWQFTSDDLDLILQKIESLRGGQVGS